MRMGSEVGGNALLRAYIWHCIAFPLIVSILMGVHFWRVRKDGGRQGLCSKGLTINNLNKFVVRHLKNWYCQG